MLQEAAEREEAKGEDSVSTKIFCDRCGKETDHMGTHIDIRPTGDYRVIGGTQEYEHDLCEHCEADLRRFMTARWKGGIKVTITEEDGTSHTFKANT